MMILRKRVYLALWFFMKLGPCLKKSAVWPKKGHPIVPGGNNNPFAEFEYLTSFHFSRTKQTHRTTKQTVNNTSNAAIVEIFLSVEYRDIQREKDVLYRQATYLVISLLHLIRNCNKWDQKSIQTCYKTIILSIKISRFFSDFVLNDMYTFIYGVIYFPFTLRMSTFASYYVCSFQGFYRILFLGYID